MRYLVALVVGFVVFYLVFSGGAVGATKADLLAWGQVFIGLALTSAVGHALPSLLRRRVSLTLSSFLTWLAAATLLGFVEVQGPWWGVAWGRELLNSMAFASIFFIPMVLLAHFLRLLVPALRPHQDGTPVHYAMSGVGPVSTPTSTL